jgi:uncharacterized protein (TIGR00661 family)
MRILYAIQGTGNGHISRARAIIPILKEKGELDLLISGNQADVDLPYPIKYRFRGLSFAFGKKGGVDIPATLLQSSALRLIRDIRSLPVDHYDLVINDFEPISAWACRLKRVPCKGLSHQAAVLHPDAPKPRHRDALGMFILKNYAPTTDYLGIHFESYSRNIFTPVIRSSIRHAVTSSLPHITVYLPAYDHRLLAGWFSRFPQTEWHLFSKYAREEKEDGHIKVFPVDNDRFVQSMVSGNGVICGAGFETPAEALFLGKKLLVVPMSGQFEQHCNAAAREKMGVQVLPGISNRTLPSIREWIERGKIIQVDYPEQTREMIDQLLNS